MYGHEAYKTNNIETASGLQLVVMLYAGAIRFGNLALQAMEENQIEEIHTNIIKVQNIVSELLASLNLDAGAISQELSSLYIYIHKLLLEANIQKNKDLLLEAIELLTTLKEGWDEILLNDSGNQVNSNISISG